MTSDAQSYSGLSTDIRERLKLRLTAGLSSAATYQTLQRHELTSNWCRATLPAMGNSAESEERLCARPLFFEMAWCPMPTAHLRSRRPVLRGPAAAGRRRMRAFNHLRLGL